MPRALTTMIGVPIPSPRTVSISSQPSRPGEHQVEHARVGALVAEPGEPDLAALDQQRVEARQREMARHPAPDDVVVLDDQHLGHGFVS